MNRQNIVAVTLIGLCFSLAQAEVLEVNFETANNELRNKSILVKKSLPQVSWNSLRMGGTSVGGTRNVPSYSHGLNFDLNQLEVLDRNLRRTYNSKRFREKPQTAKNKRLLDGLLKARDISNKITNSWTHVWILRFIDISQKVKLGQNTEDYFNNLFEQKFLDQTYILIINKVSRLDRDVFLPHIYQASYPYDREAETIAMLSAILGSYAHSLTQYHQSYGWMPSVLSSSTQVLQVLSKLTTFVAEDLKSSLFQEAHQLLASEFADLAFTMNEQLKNGKEISPDDFDDAISDLFFLLDELSQFVERIEHK